MAILREAKAWRRERPANETRSSSDLTAEEQAHAKAALRFLAKRHGGYPKLAKAMGAKADTVQGAARTRGRVSAGVALRAARVAGVPLEDVLAHLISVYRKAGRASAGWSSPARAGPPSSIRPSA